MKKRFGLFLSLCLMVCVMFAGCGQVTQLTTIYADGSRAYTYNISINSSTLQSQGIDEARAWELIDQCTKSYWASYINERPIAGVNFSCGKSTTNAGLYQISLSFDTFASYCVFHGTTTEEVAKQPADIREGLFVSQNVIVDSELDLVSDLYIEMNLIPSLITQIEQIFANEFFGGNIAKTSALFGQIQTNLIRAYPSSLKVRSNAQETTTFLGAQGVMESEADTMYTAHLWQCTLADPVPEIYIYRNVFTANNRIAWYVLGFVIALVFGAVLFAVLIYKKKKGKLNVSEMEENVVDTTASQIDEQENEKIEEKLVDNKEKINDDENLTHKEENNSDNKV